MAVDLRFKRLLDTSHPVDLILGETDDGGDDADLGTFNVSIPVNAHFEALSYNRSNGSFNVALTPWISFAAIYDNALNNTVQNSTTAAWEVGTPIKSEAAAPWDENTPLHREDVIPWDLATEIKHEIESAWDQNTPLHRMSNAPWQEGTALRGDDAGGAWEAGTPVHIDRMTSWEEATSLTPRIVTSHWQERSRDSRADWGGSWQEAMRANATIVFPWGESTLLTVDRRMPWEEARKPPPGKSIIGPPVIPPVEPCYTPPPGNAVHLLFKERWDGSTNLLFSCGHDDEEPPAQVVVPIKRVYIVINETSLWRVDGDIMIPTFSMSLSLDVDSWTWSFTASVPGQALADLEPAAFGEPVELEARINGSTYRLLAENISRDRAFGTSRLNVRGRGKSALLDAPYSPVLSFGNTIDMTAQQLMADVLTLNGVSIGWDVDWSLTDWLVPGGVWRTQGSYIAALNQIAGAAGGYIQPHPVEQELRVMHRYPVAPWDWAADVTPDFELPSAYTTREAIEWIEKTIYNRVFVSGEAGGVLGQVTRAGTDGSAVAPMIVDSLITHADAARQRGLVPLADVGRQARVTLRVPTDITGVIEPGKFVRYVDGATTRLGIVRSTNVDVGMPDVWQTLMVETHE